MARGPAAAQTFGWVPEKVKCRTTTGPGNSTRHWKRGLSGRAHLCWQRDSQQLKPEGRRGAVCREAGKATVVHPPNGIGFGPAKQGSSDTTPATTRRGLEDIMQGEVSRSPKGRYCVRGVSSRVKVMKTGSVRVGDRVWGEGGDETSAQ